VAGVLNEKGKKDKKDKKKKRKHQQFSEDNLPEVNLDYFSEEALGCAKELMSVELKEVIREKREMLSSTKGVYYENDADVVDALIEETVRASSKSGLGIAFSMDEGSSGWKHRLVGKGGEQFNNNEDTIATLQSEYAALQSALASLSKSANKMEQKLHIQTSGYHSRSAALIDSSLHSFAELQHSRIEESVYARLRGHETKGAVLREERLREDVERLEEEEMRKQKRYGELMHEKNRLLLRINGQGKKRPLS